MISPLRRSIIPETELTTFHSLLGNLAAGSYSGAEQAASENNAADQQQQQLQAQASVARQKALADQDSEMRGRAFSYAQELQKSLTPDNMKWFQDNGLLDQHQREVNSAMSVASGQTHWRAWQPQFAFSDHTGQVSPHPPPSFGSGPPGATAGGGAPSLPGMAAPQIAGVGGAASAAAARPAALPAAPPVQFTPTPAQNVAQQGANTATARETEDERNGLSNRANTDSEIEDRKRTQNRVTAKQAFDEAQQTFEDRTNIGFKSFDEVRGVWKDLLDAGAALSKAVGPQSAAQVVATIRAALHTPSALGGSTMNVGALRQLLDHSGLTDAEKNAILSDPSLAGQGGAAPAAPGAQAPGAPPVLPPAGPVAAPGAPNTAVKGSRQTLPAGSGGAAPSSAPVRPELQGMRPEARQAAMAGLEAAEKAGIGVHINSAFRQSTGVDPRGKQTQEQLYKAYLARGKTGLPAAPPGSSMHEQGLALDLHAQNGSQEALAKTLAPYGWQWAGPKDPVHFTYTGAAGAPASPPAAPGAGAGAGGGGAGAPPSPTAGLDAVGVKTPATAGSVSNPYQPNTFNWHIQDMVQNGGHSPQQILDSYANNPEKQAAARQVIDRIVGKQQGNLFPNIPRPSMMGAEVPEAKYGPENYYPDVGSAQITTQPIEPPVTAAPLPLPGRVIQQPGGSGPAAAPARTTAAPGRAATAAPAKAPPKPAPPARRPAPVAASKVPEVPPPSMLGAPGATPGPSVMSPRAQDRGRALTSADRIGVPRNAADAAFNPANAPKDLSARVPRKGGPQIDTQTGRYLDPTTGKPFPVVPGSRSDAEAQARLPETPARIMQDTLGFRRGPYGPAAGRWMAKNGIKDPSDQHNYFKWIYTTFVPALHQQGIEYQDIQQHLDKYLEAHTGKSFRTAARTLTPSINPRSPAAKIIKAGSGPGPSVLGTQRAGR